MEQGSWQSLCRQSSAEQISGKNFWLSMKAKVTPACKVGTAHTPFQHHAKSSAGGACETHLLGNTVLDAVLAQLCGLIVTR